MARPDLRSVLAPRTAPPPDPDSIFGPLVSGLDVDEVILAMAQKWLDTYLVEIERRRGMPMRAMARPRAWRISTEWERMPEDQLPAIIVLDQGTSDFRPAADGSGIYTAEWVVQVGALISAISVPGGLTVAMQYARLWASALRWIYTQQADPSQTVGQLDWINEEYGVIPAAADRSICLGTVTFRVVCYGAAQRDAGPLDPIAPPEDPNQPPDTESPHWPVAETVETTIDKVPLSEPIEEDS